MSQRFEGRNLEEALTTASQTLGVERWQLTYHVLVQKRGFLGGVKRIVIEADVNPAAAPPAEPPAPQPASFAASPAAPPPPRERRPRGERGGRRDEGGHRGGRGERDGDRGARGRGGRRREREDGGPRRRTPGTAIADLPPQEPRSAAASAVAGWIETAIELTDLDLVIRTEENDEQINVRLYGEDHDRLTDRHGELLDAIQVLANKALVGRTVEKEIELDCEGFKERRVSDLEAQAREAGDRVRRSGEEEVLPAMTPIERRIVHLALQDDAEVTTESRGEGFYKRVAIVPRASGTQDGTAVTTEP